jgi:TonB family protein
LLGWLGDSLSGLSSPRRLLLIGLLAAPLLLVSSGLWAQAASGGVTPPLLLSEPTVEYPAGETGSPRVVVTLYVSKEGEVLTAEADPSAPEPFATRAAQAARAFRFEPAQRAGRPIPARIRIEVVFEQPSPAAPPDVTPQPPAAGTPVKPPPPVEITVVGERPEPSRSVRLSRAEVRQLPGAFGDPFRAVEALPGVTPIVSGLPFFFIRGAPPGNAGYFLDGVRVPLLFHVGIGPSVVHPALIDQVDLYPGGYPARFGRFSGGVVSGETAPPSTALHGEYNLRAFDAGALVEAPFDGQRGTALVAGRYAFTALLFSLLSPSTKLDYWDYQVRTSYDVTPKDRVGVFAFGSYDYLAQTTATQNLTLFETQFHRVDLRYDRKLRLGKLRTAFTLGRDASTVQQNRDVHSTLTAARTELELRPAPSVLLRAGTDLAIERYEVDLGAQDLSPAAERVTQLFSSRSDVAVGGRLDLVLALGPRLLLTPGIRLDLFGSRGQHALGIDPRLAARLEVNRRVALLTALGVVHQPPSFVVPVPGIQPAGLAGGLQRAIQESFGLEANLGLGMLATLTLFQNAFFDMSDPLGSLTPSVNGCPPGSFAAGSLAGDPGLQPIDSTSCGPRFPPGTIGADRSGGGGQGADSRRGRRTADAFSVRTLGKAYGLELMLKRRLTRRLGGFLSYTLSRSSRQIDGRRYIATFDRTHVANLALAYELGKGYRVGARVMFYTGLPQSSEAGASGRLPAFFRLDLRAEKRWRLGQHAFFSIVAEWMNATLSKEAVATSCTLRGCEAQLIGPVTIPSLGIEGGF